MIGEVIEKESFRPVAQLKKIQPGGFPKYVKNSASLPTGQSSSSFRPQEVREENLNQFQGQGGLEESILQSNAEKVFSMTQQEIQEALQEIGSMLSTKNIEFLKKPNKPIHQELLEPHEEIFEPTKNNVEFSIQQSLAAGFELFDMEGCRLFDETTLVEKILEIWKTSFKQSDHTMRMIALHLVHSFEKHNLLKLYKDELANDSQIFYDYSNMMKVWI